jgi:hypothetical protein
MVHLQVTTDKMSLSQGSSNPSNAYHISTFDSIDGKLMVHMKSESNYDLAEVAEELNYPRPGDSKTRIVWVQYRDSLDSDITKLLSEIYGIEINSDCFRSHLNTSYNPPLPSRHRCFHIDVSTPQMAETHLSADFRKEVTIGAVTEQSASKDKTYTNTSQLSLDESNSLLSTNINSV